LGEDSQQVTYILSQSARVFWMRETIPKTGGILSKGKGICAWGGGGCLGTAATGSGGRAFV